MKGTGGLAVELHSRVLFKKSLSPLVAKKVLYDKGRPVFFLQEELPGLY